MTIYTGGIGNDLLDHRTSSTSDTLDGGLGADTMYGGDGDDTYLVDNLGDSVVELFDDATSGADIVYASVSHTLSFGIDKLTLTGFAAIDGTGNGLNNAITGNTESNTLSGEGGNDTLGGGTGNDTLNGGIGNDTMSGGEGNDTINGDAGNDVINGDAGDDDMHGGDDNDTITGFAGDAAYGEGGDDVLIMTYVDGGHVWDGGSGLDTIDFSFDTLDDGWLMDLSVANFVIWTVTFQNFENVSGSQGNDTIVGTNIANTLLGNGGNDRLQGGVGLDTLYGGDGIDTADYSEKSASVVVKLQPTGVIMAQVGGVDEDGLSSIENVTGGNGNDRLMGSGGANVLAGNGGGDVLIGGGGSDTLNGGAGSDKLDGGGGKDIFVFGTAPDVGNIDTIKSFVVAGDTIRLSAAIFTGLGAGPLAADALNLGKAASDSSDRILWDAGSSTLYYDADGFGGVRAVKFAKIGLLDGTFTEADFIIL